MKGTYFISGIDTNIGKSVATGILARNLQADGIHVITQKLIQTGNDGYSEDIELHRRIMNMEMTVEDRAGVTCPIIFTYPASPHLAAAIDKKTIDLTKIEQATKQLEQKYDVILLEGAGGLMVPLTTELLTIDYVAEKDYPVILVTSGRLGSINHTFLSFEALRTRNMSLHSVIYNLSPETDPIITQDTQDVISRYMKHYFPDAFLQTLEQVSY